MFVRLVLSAWNFRASERRAELVRAMPSAAENLKEEALQSEAIVTGHAVSGSTRTARCAWIFRASERRAELVRAMPSAAENLKEEALRRRTGFQSRTAIQKFCPVSPIANKRYRLFPFCAERDFAVCNFYASAFSEILKV